MVGTRDAHSPKAYTASRDVCTRSPGMLSCLTGTEVCGSQNFFVRVSSHYRGYTANLIPIPRYYRGSCSHSRGNTAVIVPITAVITVVTAILPPSPSPCYSVVLTNSNIVYILNSYAVFFSVF